MLKTSASLRLKPGLSMTPALQQAIRLLQMSTVDLQLEIREMLDSNLMLELARDDVSWDAATDDGAQSESDDIPDDLPIDAEWSDVFEGLSDSAAPGEALPEPHSNVARTPDLKDHLVWQAQLAGFSRAESQVAEYIIDAIDERGYLPDWAALSESLASDLAATEDRVDPVLATIQGFDPPGIAARDLKECLSLQVAQLDVDDQDRETLQHIVRHHLDDLAANDLDTVARAIERDTDYVEACCDVIRSLQPVPGTPFQNIDEQFVEPDVIVRKREGRWVASLNPAIAPRLRINNRYRALVRRGDSSSEQKTLKEHLQAARYFIGALHSRNDTLLRVAGCIIEEQRRFLDYGEEAMKPLILRDVATRLGVHESTVSRATTRKYMHTPRGLFELKYFFSSHVKTAEGGACSATAVRAMIRRLISAEKGTRPLSDSALARMLSEEGIDVARRTVAKYREAMGIPTSHERRRMATVREGGADTVS